MLVESIEVWESCRSCEKSHFFVCRVRILLSSSLIFNNFRSSFPFVDYFKTKTYFIFLSYSLKSWQLSSVFLDLLGKISFLVFAKTNYCFFPLFDSFRDFTFGTNVWFQVILFFFHFGRVGLGHGSSLPQLREAQTGLGKARAKNELG